MARLKSERHHWWPECVSKRWADGGGGVHWLLPDGEVRRATPRNFGVIGNGHTIKLGNDPAIGSCWDTNFETEFHRADDKFPAVIDWLESLERYALATGSCLEPTAIEIEPDQEMFDQMIECLLSLVVRSPFYRERSISLAERLRGAIPSSERNALIGGNIIRSLRNGLRAVAGQGKAMIIFSPERELVFGDGFFQNLTVQGQHWHNPKMLVPLTPRMGVLFVRPTAYSVDPRIVTLIASAHVADQLNFAVQVYSRRAIFYRTEKPKIDQAYAANEHMMFEGNDNYVEQLIASIPGVRSSGVAWPWIG